MKKYYIIILLCCVFSCEKKSSQNFYNINVKSKNIYNGMRSYIKTVGQRGRKIPIDTAIVMNEAFTFNGELEEPGLYYLTVDNVPGQLPIFLENSNIDIDLNKDNIFASSVTGSKSNDLYKAYNDEFKALNQKYSRANQLLNGRRVANDTDGIKKHQKNFKALQKQLKELPVKFAKENPKSYVSLYNITKLLSFRKPDLEIITDAFEALHQDLKNSTEGLKIKSRLEQFKTQAEIEAKTAVGNLAPDFSGPSTDGTVISLKEITAKSKVTLVDFWAAWCGPCRKENPNVVKMYEKYYEKGLEIIGVSLDGDPNRRQANPKKAWEEAIATDGLKWYHISNLKGFQGPIARAYNIRGIPKMFLLDNQGKIIGKDLRGYALEKELSKLLD